MRSLSIAVRRIRDIGWDPFIVLVGLVAVQCGDVVVARLIPNLAMDGHATTGVGGVANLAFSLALLFWPGCAMEPAYRYG